MKTNREIFSDIYRNEKWSKLPGEKFGSGSGSHLEKVIAPYINLLLQIVQCNNIRSIVDIGCGDFWIMRQVFSALEKNNYAYFYSGVDVVEELINYNAANFGKQNVKFYCCDFAQDDFKIAGELIIIRQVLQHLSNADIKKILQKTAAFKFVLVTESIYDGADKIYNVDKVADYKTRGDFKSGVFLEQPPYNFKNIVHLLKVQGKNGAGDIIRTSLIIND